MHIRVYLYAHAYIHTHTHTNIYTYIYIYTHTHKHMHIHTYTHAYIYTHTHIADALIDVFRYVQEKLHFIQKHMTLDLSLSLKFRSASVTGQRQR